MKARTIRHQLPRWFWPASLLLLTGCDRVFGPENPQTTSVRGRIHLGGKPFGVQFLEIAPIGGTRGVMRTAQVAPDGTFKVESVPVGRIAMRIAGRPLRRTGDRALDRFVFRVQRQAGIVRDIARGENPPIDIDLSTEQSRLRALLQGDP